MMFACFAVSARNFTEYVPIALIVCGLAEYRSVGHVWVWTIASLLVLGRLAHATGMLAGNTHYGQSVC